MSEMFNILYDEIFTQDNKVNELEDNRIDNIAKKYLSSKANLEDKKFFVKLKKEYFKIINIKDYKDIQNKLYSNKTRNEIVSFEIIRILNNASENAKVLEQVSDIDKLLSTCDGNLNDELYSKVINLIIKIEVSLGMKVGLFKELCCFFESEIENIETGLNVNGLVYTRKI